MQYNVSAPYVFQMNLRMCRFYYILYLLCTEKQIDANTVQNLDIQFVWNGLKNYTKNSLQECTSISRISTPGVPPLGVLPLPTYLPTYLTNTLYHPTFLNPFLSQLLLITFIHKNKKNVLRKANFPTYFSVITYYFFTYCYLLSSQNLTSWSKEWVEQI